MALLVPLFVAAGLYVAVQEALESTVTADMVDEQALAMSYDALGTVNLGPGRVPATRFGAAAKRTGCTVPTIRYYEEIGLLSPAARTGAGQRLYGEVALRRLTFIRRCRDFGFWIDQVRELVGLVDQPDRPCTEVLDIAAIHLADVRRKLGELKALEASLNAFVCSCETACAGGPAVDCTILEDLTLPAESARVVQRSSCCS